MSDCLYMELVEDQSMGRVTTRIRVENLEDLWKAKNQLITADQGRSIDIMNALVDTGAPTLSLPTRVIETLALSKVGERTVTTTTGISKANKYDAVRLTIMGRGCTADVLEVPDSVPALVGQVPLELLDLVVSPAAGKLTGNPDHGGEHVLELL
jgi:predicted aspartyl protease